MPADNPYVDDPAALPEVWSYGHRNAQSIIYDAGTDTVFKPSTGHAGDELNIIEPAKNYGWPAITYGIDYSGLRISPYTSYEGMEQPLEYWDPSFGPSGMTVYRGRAFAEWDGDIFMTSLVFNHVIRVDMDGRVSGAQQILFDEIGERLRDIRTGPDGALYILSEGTGAGDGRVWRCGRPTAKFQKLQHLGVDAHRPMAYNRRYSSGGIENGCSEEKSTRSRRGKRRSADALANPTYVENPDSGDCTVRIIST